MGLTERQLKLRRHTVGGSEIAALVGLHPYMKPIDVFLSKTGRSDLIANDKMEWGLRHEPAMRAKHATLHGVRVLEAAEAFPASVDGTVRHPDHPIASCTPDGIIMEPQYRIQMKCGFEHGAKAWGESGDPDGVPEHVVLQSIWEGFVTEIRPAMIIALINGWDYREYPTSHDQELAETLLGHAERFMRDYVANDVAPPVDGSESSAAYLRERFKRNNGKMLPAPAGAMKLAVDYKCASDDEKAAKARKDEAGNLLRDLIGDFDGLEAPGLKVSWKAQDATPNYKAIAEVLGATPELIAKHTPQHRVIRVTVK